MSLPASSLANLILRAGAAFAFLFPAIDALFNPYAWEGYFPNFVHQLPIDSTVLLHSFGLLEVALALWLLSGKHIRIPAAVMTLMLVAIVVFNMNDFELLFRDLSIATITLALAVAPRLGIQKEIRTS